MSLVPFIDDFMNFVQRPVNIFDQHFGMGMLGDDLLNPSLITPFRAGYYRPWRSQAARYSGVSQVQSDKEGFRVST
jgi:Alpha crystallin A chain, N terminal.